MAKLNEVCYPIQPGKCHAQWWTFSFCLRNSLQAEATNITTLLENNLITPNRDLSPFQQFLGREREAITMYRADSLQTMLVNCGTPSFWVSFTEGHPVGNYHVDSSKTKRIISTTDVTILQKSYRDWNKNEKCGSYEL